MMNYMKSEHYRALHNRSLWFFVVIMTGIVLLMNFTLWALGMKDPEFRYNISSFSYSMLVSSPMLFIVTGALIAVFFYEGYRKNGCIKNAVSGGLEREKTYIAQCLVVTVISLIIMGIVLLVYIGSATILLEQNGPVDLMDLLMEIPAVLLCAVASLSCMILFLWITGSEALAAVCWAVLWLGLPRLVFVMGLVGINYGVSGVYRAAMCMPANFMNSSQMAVNMSSCVTVWDTAEGMMHCVASGMAGIPKGN